MAISRKFTIEETISAGFTTSAVVLVFSASGLLRWFSRVIPIPVVKGIQVGAGLSLVVSAGSSLLQPLGWVVPNGADNLLWATFAFLTLLITLHHSKIPYALLVFFLGLGLSLIVVGREYLPHLSFWRPHTYVPSWKDFKVGALDAGLGQIPLTTLNSIIAVSYLSADLLPNIQTPTVTTIGISVALMNLIGGWFGAMPVCHGSGGLAAQYRFGARSGASVILLGLFKIILGLLFGESLIGLLREYPKSLLGVMVVAAGLELAKVGESLNHGARDLWEDSEGGIGDQIAGMEGLKHQRELTDKQRKERWTVMFMTVGGLLAFRNDGVGFLAGLTCHWAYESSGLLKFVNRRGQRDTERTRRASLDEEEQLLT